MTPSVLITAFGAFGPFRQNPSQQVLEELLQGVGSGLNACLESVVLPVDYQAVSEFIENRRATPPDWAFHLGVATGAEKMRLEVFARNQAAGEDVRGLDPAGEAIDPAGADLHTHLGLSDLEAFASVREQKVEISKDAGTYLCNFLFYQSLRNLAIPHGTRSLFVHIADPVHASGAVPLQRQAVLLHELILHLLPSCDSRS